PNLSSIATGTPLTSVSSPGLVQCTTSYRTIRTGPSGQAPPSSESLPAYFLRAQRIGSERGDRPLLALDPRLSGYASRARPVLVLCFPPFPHRQKRHATIGSGRRRPGGPPGRKTGTN